ncbi:MAG TPA: hypothetical protein VLK34_02640 [Nocardioidaceae bacterium]|nr:hypothetical protein [Nocardioidaceae bacterium]
MRRYLAGAVALTAAAALLASTPAIAGGPTDPNGGEVGLGMAGGLKYISETHNVGDGGTHTPPYDATDIACGPHTNSPWHVVSGGAAVKAPAQQTLLAVMRPMDLDPAFESPDNAAPDDWWESVVKSVVGHKLTGYAICSKKPSHYVLHTTPTSASSNRTDTVSCAAGDAVVGGGAFIATTDSFVNSSYPIAGGWRIRVRDTVGGAGGMQAYAVCRPNGQIDSRLVAVEHKNVAPGTAASATALCGASRHVSGGGGRLTGRIGQAWLSASRPIDGSDADSVPDDGWRVTGYNSSGSSKSLRAIAVCVTSG